MNDIDKMLNDLGQRDWPESAKKAYNELKADRDKEWELREHYQAMYEFTNTQLNKLVSDLIKDTEFPTKEKK